VDVVKDLFQTEDPDFYVNRDSIKRERKKYSAEKREKREEGEGGITCG
jgi:hypothetical protein